MKKLLMAATVLGVGLSGFTLPVHAQSFGIELPTKIELPTQRRELENFVQDNTFRPDLNTGRVHVNTPGGPGVHLRFAQWSVVGGNEDLFSGRHDVRMLPALPSTYYSFCATRFGNSPTIKGGFPDGAPCLLPTPSGTIAGRLVGWFVRAKSDAVKIQATSQFE